MKIDDLLTPAIVAAIVSAIVGPLVFFFLKRWDDKNRRTFDIRYNEYKHYLKALEQISASSHAEFETFLGETYAEYLEKILTTEGDATHLIIELNNNLNKLTSNVRKAFIQATQELNGLRLVCSKALFEMVNEFISIQRQLLDESVSLMSRVKEISLHNPKSILTDEMKLKGEQAQSLFEKIVIQMRSELKIK